MDNNTIMDETVELNDDRLREYFDTDIVSVWDLVNGLHNLLEEKEVLERKLEEEYEPKKTNYYDDFGINEEDF